MPALLDKPGYADLRADLLRRLKRLIKKIKKERINEFLMKPVENTCRYDTITTTNPL